MTDTLSSGAIDFHTHHIPARFEVTAGRTAPANQQQRWQALAQKLADEALLVKDIRDGTLSARVVNIPAQLMAGADGRVPHETIVTMNDELSALVARHPGRIYGLASVDGTTAMCLRAKPSAQSASLACAASSWTARAAR
jgi:hypothetical protein